MESVLVVRSECDDGLRQKECCPCDQRGSAGSFWVGFALFAVSAAVLVLFLEIAQNV